MKTLCVVVRQRISILYTKIFFFSDNDEILSIPRSSSIDSMVESKNCSPLSRRLPSPLLSRAPYICPGPPPPLSPSVARRLKGQRAQSGKTYHCYKVFEKFARFFIFVKLTAN